MKEHNAFNAAYNSRERECDHANLCQEGTRADVINKITAWIETDVDRTICLLHGPAGSGKTAIAHTIAQQCAGKKILAGSFFFSRGRQDRNDTNKFLPTLAYQLATSLPSIQSSMQAALAHDLSIPFQSFGDQFKKLIVDPIRTISEPVPSMIIVIDALDECAQGGLPKDLIRLLMDNLGIPMRFLLTSRPEDYILKMFKLPRTQSGPYILALQDFSAHEDIRKYLQLHLSNIRQKEDELMQDVPIPWPSYDDLETLVRQSQGLFIYVSTLVAFVGDGSDLPQQKLQTVIKTHAGIDALYDQVLSAAGKFHNFKHVIGTMMYLLGGFSGGLTINELGQLLQLPAANIRLALRGCKSILVVPGSDDYIHPYHASLQDFLTDLDRATKDHYLDPVEHHGLIMGDCINLIIGDLENNIEDGKPLQYACQYWCRHLHLALSYAKGNDYVKLHLGPKESLIQSLCFLWMKEWMCIVGSKENVVQVRGDLYSVCACIRVGHLYLKYDQV